MRYLYIRFLNTKGRGELTRAARKFPRSCAFVLLSLSFEFTASRRGIPSRDRARMISPSHPVVSMKNSRIARTSVSVGHEQEQFQSSETPSRRHERLLNSFTARAARNVIFRLAFQPHHRSLFFLAFSILFVSQCIICRKRRKAKVIRMHFEPYANASCLTLAFHTQYFVNYNYKYRYHLLHINILIL